MSITDHAALDALCDACGIANGYYDISGSLHQPGIEDIGRHLETLRSREWRRIIASVMVFRQSGSSLWLRLSLTPAQCAAPVRWELLEEGGRSRQGSWELQADHASGEYWLDEVPVKRFDVELTDVSDIGLACSFTRCDPSATGVSVILAICARRSRFWHRWVSMLSGLTPCMRCLRTSPRKRVPTVHQAAIISIRFTSISRRSKTTANARRRRRWSQAKAFRRTCGHFADALPELSARASRFRLGTSGGVSTVSA
jgi:hypothetical protein